MPIAAWTLHLTEYHADGGFRLDGIRKTLHLV
jgi:hypothetical protein